MQRCAPSKKKGSEPSCVTQSSSTIPSRSMRLWWSLSNILRKRCWVAGGGEQIREGRKARYSTVEGRSTE
jgi:hypothetical protein